MVGAGVVKTELDRGVVVAGFVVKGVGVVLSALGVVGDASVV